MSLGRFTFHQPATAAEACALGLQYGRKSAYLAGGTELLVVDEVEHITRPLPLSDIAASAQVREFVPALCDAIGTMAGRQIRNRGTMGGNFCCGVPCSDTPPIACAAGAEVVLTGPDGPRTVAAREFVLAPRVTVLKPGEILTEIRFARQPEGSGAAFQRFALRKGSALAVASVSAWVRRKGELIVDARIFMGAVGPVPLAAPEAAAHLKGKKPSVELFAEAGELAAAEAQPISDLRGSEGYRRDIVQVLCARALEQANLRAEGGE